MESGKGTAALGDRVGSTTRRRRDLVLLYCNTSYALCGRSSAVQLPGRYKVRVLNREDDRSAFPEKTSPNSTIGLSLDPICRDSTTPGAREKLVQRSPNLVVRYAEWCVRGEDIQTVCYYSMTKNDNT